MFSSIIELIQKIQEAKLRKQKKETKKVVKKEEKKIEEKEEKSLVEAKSKAKKTKEVKKETLKEIKLKAKVLALKLLKYVVKIIESFVKFLIMTFGVMGFFVILVVIVLMIAIYGLLHIDFDLPAGDIYNGVNEDCIQGEQVLNSVNWNELNINSLNGTLTEYQKNLFKTFSLVEEFIKSDGTNSPLLKELPEDIAFNVYRGIPAVESSFYIFGPSDTSHDVLKDMLDSSENDSYIGPHQIAKNATIDDEEYYRYWSGKNFVSSWKTKYVKPDNSIKDQFWMPYSVAMSIMHASKMGTYGVLNTTSNNYSEFKAYVEATMDHFGIQANREECFQYIRALLSLCCYLQGHSLTYLDYNSEVADDGTTGGGKARIEYLCAVFAASSDNDAARSFNNYSVILNNETKYQYAEAEGSLREWLIGSSGYDSLISDIGTLEIGSGKNSRLKVGDTELTVPLMRYIYDKYKDDAYMTNCWTHIKSVKGQFLSSYNYGLACLLQGNHIVAEMGVSAPVASGGNSEDCDCVESGGGYAGSLDISNIQVGQVQGPWSENTKQKLMGYGTDITQYFGQANSIVNPDVQLAGSGKTFEQWRQETKWKVPYYKQTDDENYPENGKGCMNSYISDLGTLGKAGCHIYMYSYIASALTGTVINPVEMTCGLREVGGIVKEKAGGMQGWNQSSQVSKSFNDLGLKAVSFNSNGYYGDTSDFESFFSISKEDFGTSDSSKFQQTVDVILEKNGLVGLAMGPIFTARNNHYVVVTEKVGSEYRVMGYGTSGGYSYDSGDDLYTWDVIFKSMFNHNKENSSYNGQRVIGWNPNLSVSGGSSTSMSSSSNSTTVEVPNTLAQTGLIADYTDYVWFYPKWTSSTNQRKVADLWGQTGKKSSKGIATINDLYLVAVRAKFGAAGDAITLVLEDSTNINCIIADIKGSDAADWGHNYDGAFSLVEWEVIGDGSKNASGVNIELGDWKNKKISKIINYGSYLTNPNIIKDSGKSSVNCIESPINGDFKDEPGVFQGPWGDLTQYVNQLSNESIKSKYLNLIPYVGMKPVNEGESNYLYNVDKWKQSNGKGFVRYNQGNGNKSEPWADLSYGGDIFVNSACGAYSTSGVISTMTGKYINPVEVAIAMTTYSLRHPGESIDIGHTTDGIFRYTALAEVIKECGLKAETTSTFDINKVDACLNNDGMVIYVVGSDYSKRYTSSGHYVVIREKTDTGYLVFSSTNWVRGSNDDYCNTENTAHELEVLCSNNNAQMILVTR